MKKENMMMLVTIIIVVTLIAVGFVVVKISSGVNPPYTVIESESMQHSDKSQIGIIDTGDMVLVRSVDKCEITTFVEDYATGNESFGNYGSVIIYKRAVGNPVIHRAILWLEWNNVENKWSAPSLENYDSGLWNCTASTDCNSLSGTLNIILKSDYRTISISIDLDNGLNKTSGYITMGDNNGSIDQNTGISPKTLIDPSRIKSVAWKEIPWIGSLKLISKGQIEVVEQKVPNTLPCLAASFITVILVIISIGFIIDESQLIKIKKK